jgi:hypothetical protein
MRGQMYGNFRLIKNSPRTLFTILAPPSLLISREWPIALNWILDHIKSIEHSLVIVSSKYSACVIGLVTELQVFPQIALKVSS